MIVSHSLPSPEKEETGNVAADPRLTKPAADPRKVWRTHCVRYVGPAGHTVMEVAGDTVDVVRMGHNREQIIRLMLALTDHMSGPGGPLEFCEDELVAIRRELHAHLAEQ